MCPEFSGRYSERVVIEMNYSGRSGRGFVYDNLTKLCESWRNHAIID